MFTESVLKRIKPYIYDSDECIEYPILSTDGYGRLGCRIEGRSVGFRAHRVSYSIYYNIELTPDQFILHSCDNKKCCNVKHLRIGNHRDNCNDRIERGQMIEGGAHPFYKHGKYSKETINRVKKETQERGGLRSVCDLTIDQVIELKRLFIETKLSCAKLSIITKIPYHTAKRIKSGQIYKSVSIAQ